LRRFLPPEKPLPIDYPEMAVLVGDLGFSLIGQGHFKEAELLLSKAIAALEQKKDFQEYAVIALSNLSGLYAQTGRLADALAYSSRALDLLDTVPNRSPTTVIKTLGNAAVLAALDEKTGRAETLFQDATAVAEATLSPTDPLMGQILEVYAQFLRQTDRGGKARQLERKASSILAAFQQQNYLGQTVEARTLRQRDADGDRP